MGSTPTIRSKSMANIFINYLYQVDGNPAVGYGPDMKTVYVVAKSVEQAAKLALDSKELRDVHSVTRNVQIHAIAEECR